MTTALGCSDDRLLVDVTAHAAEESDDTMATDDESYNLAMSAAALKEIAAAIGDVNMHGMPHIPVEAPCRLPGSDPNDWFDPLRSLDLIGVDPRFINEIAESLCEGCPVLSACLGWGLANPRQDGILGGMTHKQRLKLIRDMKRNRPTRPRTVRPAA